MRLTSRDFVLAGLALLTVAGASIAGCSDDETSSTLPPTTTSGPTSSSTGMVSSSTGMAVSSSTMASSSTGMGGSGGATGGMGGMPAGGMGGMPGGGMGGSSMGGASMGGMGGMGTGGMGGGQMVGTENAFFWGDFVTNDTHQVGYITYPGPVITPFSLDGLMTSNNISSAAVSPNGMNIAVAARDTVSGNNVINVYNANGMGLATNLVTGTATNVDFVNLAYSPDGQWIAYRSDASINGGFELWVVPSGGGTAKRVSPQFTNAANSVSVFAWQPDVSGNLKYIAYRADPTTDNVQSLFTVEITSNTPAPVNVVPEVTTTTQVVSNTPPVFDAQGHVYFRGDFITNDLFQLFSADITGANRVQVPGSILMNTMGEASIGSFGMSPDGSMIAFAADAITIDNYQVYVLDLATTTPVQVSSIVPNFSPATGFAGPIFAIPIVWSADNQWLGIIADWPVNMDSDFQDANAFVVPTTGAPGGVRVVHVPQGGAQAVEQVAFTTDSALLLIRGDTAVNNDNVLSATTDFVTADQTPASLVVQGVPAMGDINGVVIAP